MMAEDFDVDMVQFARLKSVSPRSTAQPPRIALRSAVIWNPLDVDLAAGIAMNP